jgi:FAD/FMN-containing dehydrogenase
VSVNKSLRAAEKLTQLLASDSELFFSEDSTGHYLASCEGYQRDGVWVIRLSGSADAQGQPHYLQEISAILRLANVLSGTEESFTVHPISTGNNWGYGSALAADDAAVILDLSRLTHIQVEDADLGLFSVGPGVTQQMLREFLDRRQLPFMVPVTGAGPHCSLLANALERGYGITPYTDHFGAVNALKAFLPDGQRYHSSISSIDSSANDLIDKTFKWKLGPYLDGLFTQSNLGIVTEVTLRLKKNPADFDSFYLQFADDKDFESAVLIARELLQRLEGTVGSINIMDKRRVLSMMVGNPNGAGNHQIMSAQQVEQLGKKHDVPAWTLIGTLYGEPEMVKAGRRIVNRLSAGKVRRRIYSNGWLVRLGKLAVSLVPGPLLAEPRKMLQSLDNGTAIMQGTPNQVALPLAFWRNPQQSADPARAMDPARDNCGLLWYAPLVLFQPKSMRTFVEHVRATAPKYGIEPMITFTSLRHDTVDSTIPIVFDKSNATAQQQAKDCLHDLVTKGLQQGFAPYRLNLEQQTELIDHSAVCWQWADSIKQATDPKQILSPGRYSLPKHKTK